MTFSDADLKKLKKLIKEPTKWSHLQCSCLELQALIARLECAEAVIKEADQHGFTDKAMELHTAWEKSYGK